MCLLQQPINSPLSSYSISVLTVLSNQGSLYLLITNVHVLDKRGEFHLIGDLSRDDLVHHGKGRSIKLKMRWKLSRYSNVHNSRIKIHTEVQCIRKRQAKDRNTKSFSVSSMKGLLQEADRCEFGDSKTI